MSLASDMRLPQPETTVFASQLKVVAYVKSMNGGGSKAQLVQGSDGKLYVIKLIGNPQGTRILANEFMVGKIAQILDAPCPRVTMMEVDQVTTDNINRLSQSRFQAGIQFAQDYVGGSVQVFPSNLNLMTKTNNIEKWPNAIILDSLVQNEDLKDTHILITIDPGSKGSRFWHIDHGHCLGVTRGWASLNPNNAVMRSSLYSNIVFGPDPFKDGLDRMRAMNKEDIERIMAECPLEKWGLVLEERDALISYLLSAKFTLENSIKASRHMFPNWQ